MGRKFLNMILIVGFIISTSFGFSNTLPQLSANNNSGSILTFHVPNPGNDSYYMGLEVNGKSLPGSSKITKGTTENTVEQSQAGMQKAISSGYEKLGNNIYVFYKCNVIKCDKSTSVSSFSQDVQIQQYNGSYIVNPGSVNITWFAKNS